MNDARLRFTAHADGDARLRFGDEGSSGEQPASTTTPMRATCGAHWQQAAGTLRASVHHWQSASGQAMQPTPMRGRWQEADKRHAALRAPWAQRRADGFAQRHHWQDADALRAAMRALWQSPPPLRAIQRHHWQEGEHRRRATRQQWAENLRLRAAGRHHWQEGTPARSISGAFWHRQAERLHHAERHFWQEAMRARAGVSWHAQDDDDDLVCYDPDTLGRLVFWQLWEAPLARLVFVCEHSGGWNPPQPGDIIIVPPRRYIIVVNEIDITLEDGTPLPCEAFSMTLDDGSWTWSFSASFKREALPALLPSDGNDGQPVRLTARINGQPFALLAESITRSVRFPERLIRVNGRGLAALLDAPHAPQQSFTHAAPRTAHQLAIDALTVNGVGMGWDIDWRLQDWLVPAGVWVHQGTWASALADIAQAAGGWILPADNEQRLSILPKWPKPWWEWSDLPVDIELPAGIAEVEETAWTDHPNYERIFISGEGAGGILGDYKRAGTAGALVRAQVVHPLITDEVAARQRAIAELAESGRMVSQSLTLMVLPETGIIRPGKVLRYTDDGGSARLGIVRSCAVNWAFPALTQTIGVQSHD